MAIPQTFIQELLARADVVDIIGRHVQLKKGGANFMGLCPFHGEKSPSFSVSPAKQFYHCFGCGKSGNAIGFLMDHTGMPFIEAVKDLAQQYGLQVPEDDVSPEDRTKAAQTREQQATLTTVLEKAGIAYIKSLRNSPRAIDYLKGRGLSGEVAKTFGLGYAPEGWRSLASVFPDYGDALLVESGLVIAGDAGDENAAGEAKRYDRFRDRIMFPIRNVKGQCIGFGGRVLGDDVAAGKTAATGPKYLNSPETPVFSKGRELYGLFEARTALREHGYALVTEGYMDVVALAQMGFANAVATLGTACSAEHVQKLFRFTDSVVFSFDGDSAGRRAARKALSAALPFATDVRTVKFLFLPAEHDPDSYIREHGKDGFADCVAKALPLSKFMLHSASENCDLDTAEGLARLTSQVGPMWQLLPAGAFKSQMLAAIADKVQMDSRDLEQAWQPKTGSYKNNSVLRPKHVGYNTKTSSKTPLNDSQEAMRPCPEEPDYPPIYDDRHDRGYSDQDHHFSTPLSSQFPPIVSAAVKPQRRLAGRLLPASREDRVLRLLFTEPKSWDRLNIEEHLLLCALPAPHGLLFAWLENQLHDHGEQPWAALREGLRGYPHEQHVVTQIAQMHDSVESHWSEVRSILDDLFVEQFKREQAALIAQGDSFLKDPIARQRYQMLQTKIRQTTGPKIG